MNYNSEIHNRRSIRLDGYDYKSVGHYFITMCTNNRECLFGNINEGEIQLNDAGKMLKKWYFELENKYFDMKCDAYIVMPNHFHAILINVGANLCVRPCLTKEDERISISTSLRNIVQWFKTMTTNEYIRGVRNKDWQTFDKKLWQRNYFDHIIRDEDDLNRIRKYIENNPKKWNEDEDNPNNFIS